MRKKRLHIKTGLAMLALAPLLWLDAPANAQSVATQDNKTVQDKDINREQLAHFDQFLDSHREIAEQLRKDPSLVDNGEFVKSHPELQTYLQDHPAIGREIREHPDAFMRAEARFDRREDSRDRNSGRDRDVTRQELSNFDRFLDGHREISEQLHKDPSLVDNREFVKNHPALQTYLQDHPGVREEFKENPNGFMQAENRYDRREDERNISRDRDVTRQELSNFDRFLDSHREISEQLRRDPSLVDNREFVKNHPALQTYLQDHPGVREEFKENPNGFMQAENRYDRREDNRDRDSSRDRDVTRQELSNFDRFLDNHREIAERLRKDPSLVDNRDFVKDHPELQTYLQDHPGVREEIKENPNSFMQAENRYDRHEDATDRDSVHKRFGEFLGGHSNIAQQLSQDPSLVKNQEYLENHPELQEYLKAHADVQQKLMENPQNFVKSAQQFNTNTNGKGVKVPEAKPNK
jgi:hypothetical protein